MLFKTYTLFPLKSVIFKYLINELIFLLNISVCSLKILNVSSEIKFLSKTRYSCDLVSPHEAFAMERNCTNSLLPFLSNPSAILSIIDPDEPSI